MLNLTGKEVIQQLKSDDTIAFESLYRSFSPKLNYFTNQYLLDSEASRNIVQDVFTELWDRRKTFREDTNIQAWMFTVTKNKSLKYINKQKSREKYSRHLKTRQLDINYKALEGFDTSNFMLEELLNLVETTLNKLSPSCRKVFEMSRFDGMRNQQIADELNLSIKTVEAHISKALKLFHSELKDYLPILYFFFYLNK